MSRFLAAICAATLAAGAAATVADDRAADNGTAAAESGQGGLKPGEYEEVPSMPALTRLYSFHALDRDTLIVWRTRSDAYLIELRRASPDLPFARGIGVTSWGGRVHAGFDDVRIDGLRYPIDAIYKLSRAEAERLRESS